MLRLLLIYFCISLKVIVPFIFKSWGYILHSSNSLCDTKPIFKTVHDRSEMTVHYPVKSRAVLLFVTICLFSPVSYLVAGICLSIRAVWKVWIQIIENRISVQLWKDINLVTAFHFCFIFMLYGFQFRLLYAELFVSSFPVVY